MSDTPTYDLQRSMAINALMAYVKAALADPGADYDRQCYKLADVLKHGTPLRHWPDWLFDLDGLEETAAYLRDHYPQPLP